MAALGALVAGAACGGSGHAAGTADRAQPATAATPRGDPADVGPFLPDPADPAKKDTHWHAALGVYDCDHWLGDGSNGPGTWTWPFATPAGEPARAANPDAYAGLHSHDDGIIHMEPATADEAGVNATLGRYFAFGGWSVSATGFSFLGTTVHDGDRCPTGPARVHWEVGTWDGDPAATNVSTYTVESGDPARYKLQQFDVVVIAFLPEGTPIARIGNPPSVQNLDGVAGVENAPAGSPPSSS